MKRLIALWLLLIIPAVSNAQTIVLDLSGLGVGTHYYAITKTQTGQVTFSPLPILVLTASPTPQPPSPQPPITDLSERAKAVRDAVITVPASDSKAATTANLTAAANQIQQWVGPTLKGYEQIAKASQFIFDEATKANKDDWAGVRKVVFDELAKLAQEGADDAAFANYFGEVSSGLQAASSQQGMAAADREFLKWLLEVFVKYILPIILKGL